MPTPLESALAVLALALISWAGWFAFCVHGELKGIGLALGRLAADQGRMAGHQRGMRQQLGNLLAMLMRAGYKPAPARDWSDDEQQTLVRGEGTETKWDWRAPADG